MKKLIFFSALILSGCTEDNSHTATYSGREVNLGYVLSVSVPPVLNSAFEKSVSYWRDQTGTKTRFFISVREDDAAVLVKIRALGEPILGLSFVVPTESPDGSKMYVTGGSMLISSRILSDSECVDRVLTHELGHFLSLADDSNTGRIMDGETFWCHVDDLSEHDRDLIQADFHDRTSVPQRQ